MTNAFDIGIRCDFLLSMANESVQPQRDYFIGIQGHKIAMVTPWSENAFQAKKWIHAKNKVVMPGLVNGHTHLAMTLFRGLADDQPFSVWLFDYILPLERKLVNREFVRAGTELAALESIRCGVTTVNDMYFYADVVADTLDRAGMRALVAEPFMQSHPFIKDSLHESFQQLDQLYQIYQAHERISPALAPHAIYSCGDELLKKVCAYSKKYSLPIHIHVSETQNEVTESLKKHSKTPVTYLYDLGILHHKTICAHMVHVTDADIELMQKTQASVVYNPESNMKLGSGVAPIPKYLRKNITVGMGTDGAASNNDLSLFREMDTGTKLQKLFNHDNMAMTATQALKMTTIGGAKVLGLDQKIGSIEVGKNADIILVDLNYPHLQPVHDIASLLVYSTSGLEVDTVICHGKVLMENTKFLTLDSEKIYQKASQFRDQIQASLEL